MSERKLTVGMLTYDDFDGFYFSLMAARFFHPECAAEIEFLILDNNPDSAHGQEVRRTCEWVKEARYVPVRDGHGTSLRDRVFQLARTPYVLCMDSHVLLEAGALRKLIDFYDRGNDDGDLLQGPMLYDDLHNISTHFDPVWRGQMWGVWGTDGRGTNPNAPPFEIPAQGLGLFSCRKDAWLGFNPSFRGFGGEECYIHEKFRQAGKKTLCLPFLRWLHRFPRPGGVPYPLKTEDRVFNYMVGFAELGLDPEPIRANFREMFDAGTWRRITDEAMEAIRHPAKPKPVPAPVSIGEVQMCIS